MDIPPPDHARRHALDGLAAWVADRLEAGEHLTAWTITLALEGDLAGIDTLAVPPMPVIARRFARAHASLLADDEPRGAEPSTGCLEVDRMDLLDHGDTARLCSKSAARSEGVDGVGVAFTT